MAEDIWAKIRLASKGPDVKTRARVSEGKRKRVKQLATQRDKEQERINKRMREQEWELKKRYRFLMDKSD